MAERAEEARSLEELLGIEGNAARLYFGDFAGMMKPDEERATERSWRSIWTGGTGVRRGIR